MQTKRKNDSNALFLNEFIEASNNHNQQNNIRNIAQKAVKRAILATIATIISANNILTTGSFDNIFLLK